MSIQDEIKRKQPRPIETNDFGKKIKIKKEKDDGPNKIVGKFVYFAAIIVFIAAMYILFDYFRQGLKTSELNSDLQSISNSLAEVTTAQTTEAKGNEPRPLLPLAQQLLTKNSDTVGWVKINNTKVDLPVVLKKDGTDKERNLYYLEYNFLHEKNQSGAIFADYRTTIEDQKQSDNIVLYGHDEKSNEMFGDLDLYKQKWSKAGLDFYKQNPTFEFNTNYEQGTYKIFAYFVTTVEPYQEPDGVIFDYNNYIDFDEARYNDFMENVMKRNKIITNVDCKFGDKFVTLSTCSNEFEPSRFVIFGRKVREGEDPNVNVDNVTYNKDAKTYDYDFIVGKK